MIRNVAHCYPLILPQDHDDAAVELRQDQEWWRATRRGLNRVFRTL